VACKNIRLKTVLHTAANVVFKMDSLYFCKKEKRRYSIISLSPSLLYNSYCTVIHILTTHSSLFIKTNR
jgi:hypothetical protein